MGSKSDAARLKAQQLKAEQQRKEKRTRMMIYSVVGALVLATVLAVAWVLLRPTSQEPTASPSAADSPVSFVVSADGVGKVKDGSVLVREFFDYSCHACADVDVILGEKLTEGIDAGRISVEFIPVDVVNMEWHPVAAQAASVVYDQDPQHFLQFHHALMQYFSDQFRQQNPDVIKNTEASVQQVKTLAEGVGVPGEVVAKLGADIPPAFLLTNTEYWKNLAASGREGLATPEFVVNDTSIRIRQEDVADPVSRFEEVAKTGK
ncbi:MAG: thioredoxin domain-containing protein [Actinomycetaceae bacterium]|nr:thioredoxin domain-containing protein [Actinomycetaceae bacterium]